MIRIPSEVHFWTSRDEICIPETEFGAFRYHEKKEVSESIYLESKKFYALGRGITWAASSKKSHTVKKDALRELEEQLRQHKMVKSEWIQHDLLYTLLSSGLIISIRMSSKTGDILHINTDKYLVGKLPSESITDLVFGKKNILLTYSDAMITLIHLTKPAPVKLGRQEPRLSTFDLAGPTGRRLERKLSLNLDETLVLVWWRCSQDEVYPWSPVVRDCDRANIMIYSISGPRLELICFYKTEGDPISVTFSKHQSNIVLLVEQKCSRAGEVSLENSTFEVAFTGQLLRSPTIGALQLKTHACCLARSPDETRLAVGCIDGSVLLYSPSATLLVRAAFIPSLITWHPDGIMVVVATEKGQIQCFDLALAPVRLQLLIDEPAYTANLIDLSTYFRYQPTMSFIAFNKQPFPHYSNGSSADGYLLMYFERGPFAVLRLTGGGGGPGLGGVTPETLVSQYVHLDLVDNAINLLSTLGWDTQGAICLSCMHRICNNLFSQPLSSTTENQLEAALGTFMSPSVPLSLAAERQYGSKIHDLARRFFFHLVRYQRIEKAFRLAIDLGDRDLFMDLYHVAREIEDDTLAEAAKQKAAEIDDSDDCSDSTSSSCDCSRSSCSVCGSLSPSVSSSSSDEALERSIVKPKVTFSDTVTHIAAIRSAAEDDGDDEDDEIQAFIV